jgi:hypothetical protein
MRKLLFILILFSAVAAHGQQNMPSVGYRFWQWARIGTGLNDVGVNHPTVALHIGRAGGNQGVYLYPQDSSTIVSPPQGLVISLASDSARLYQWTGRRWERCGGNGGTGGSPGGPFENPLGFSNGLTRTGNNIKWGGTLVNNTNINGASFNITFTNTKLGVNQSAPAFDLDVNGTGRIVNLPNAGRRDTVLTYIPGTKQLAYTYRPVCADSATVTNLVVGTDIVPSDSVYTSVLLIGKNIKIFREGDLQYQDEYTYNSSLGRVTFHPPLNFRERIRIESLCIVGFGVSPPYILTNGSEPITTQAGEPIIY